MIVKAQYEMGALVIEGGGGYAVPDLGRIYVDPQKNLEQRRLITIHEVLEVHLHGEVRHARLDRIALDIINALDQLGLWGKKDEYTT